VKFTATSQLFVRDMTEVRILSGIYLNAAERTALKRKIVYHDTHDEKTE
jgi:hypothetical protein